LALEDQKPVTKWFSEKRITADSSFREVRALRSGKHRKGKRADNPSNTVRRSFPATISMSFETYTAAAESLSSFLLSSKADFRISAHQSFDAALREHLNDDDYEKAKDHIS